MQAQRLRSLCCRRIPISQARRLSLESLLQNRQRTSECWPWASPKEEMATFVSNNDAYKAKFGFPFVLAVRNARKGTILGSFTTRLQNSPSAELAEGNLPGSQDRVDATAHARGAKPTGFLTCHVLDTARGCPAAGMSILTPAGARATGLELSDVSSPTRWRLSDDPALKGEAFFRDLPVDVQRW